MADEDSRDDPPSGAKGRRRRKPPVIELQAREIAGEDAGARPRDNDSNRPEAAAPTSREPPQFAPIAAAIGAVAGAAVAILVVFLFDRGTDPRVAKLGAEVAALDQRLGVVPRSADPAALAAVSERIERLATAMADAEKRIAAVAARPAPPVVDLSPLTSRLSHIETEIGRLRSSVAERPAAVAPALIEAIEKRVSALEERIGRIGALEERIGALAASVRTSAAPAVAAEVVALSALKDALGSGTPFAIELAAVRALLGERGAVLQKLESAAAKGVPTTAELTRRFAELAPALARQPETEGGYWSRLAASASRLVEVRPVGEAKGESAGAIVARVEARLKQNDFVGALAEAERLPAAMKAVAADWLTAARLRRDAEAQVRQLISHSLAALAGERGR